MGNSAAGGRTTRALRRLGPVVAAAAGAAVVAATVMGRRRRRPPEQPGLASPASAADPVLAPVTDLSAARATRATVIASAAAADAEPARSVRPLSGPGHDLRPAAAAAGASGSGEQPAAPGAAVGTQAAVGPADEPWPVEPAATTSTGASAPAGSLPPNEPTGRAAAAAAATPDAHAGGPPRRPPAAAAATPDTHAAGPPGRPAGLAPRRIRDRAGLGPSRRSRAVLGGVVALGLVAGVGAVVASSGGGDRPDTAIESGTAGQAGSEGDAIGEGGTATEAGGDAASTTEVDVTMTTPVAVTAATAFPAAADRLTAAGTFSYTGTVSATDVSHVRPMLWLSVESTLEGQVSLAAGRLHEMATTSDGRVAETVTSGPQVWGRRAGSRGGLAAVPYESVPALSDAEPATKGAVLLPAWLASVVNPADAGPDESGRRRFSATVPAAVLGAIERERPPVDATVVLTLDAAGAPVRVEITSAPGGPPLHLVYDLAGLGAPVDIQPPA